MTALSDTSLFIAVFVVAKEYKIYHTKYEYKNWDIIEFLASAW